MLVTIDTLNGFGYEVASSKEKLIESLVKLYERTYFNLTLSPELSAVFTDERKDDERFTKLRESAIINVCGQSVNTTGLDFGVNSYIYFFYLLKQYEDITQSGQTVAAPKNTLAVDPRAYANDLWRKALNASDEVIYQIETDEDQVETYSEYANAVGLCTRSGFNF